LDNSDLITKPLVFTIALRFHLRSGQVNFPDKGPRVNATDLTSCRLPVVVEDCPSSYRVGRQSGQLTFDVDQRHVILTKTVG
jgi:hypothetical protein